MLRIFLAALLLISMAIPAFAHAGGEIEKISDCEFWKTDMVSSISSGARGHVINGRLQSGHCKYDVRLYLGGRLMVVESMSDYELEKAPEKEAEVVCVTEKDPLEGLDFGN